MEGVKRHNIIGYASARGTLIIMWSAIHWKYAYLIANYSN